MGLRIGTNIGALTALRNLNRLTPQEFKTFEQLSTGLSINRGSDDPSGLIILNQLRSQMAGVSQAIENTQGVSNLVRTAEAGLGQISEQLTSLRSLITASLNSGVVGPEGREALQATLDQALSSINRIGQTTRFADRNLLNGSLDFTITNGSPELTNIQVQGGAFEAGFPATVNVNVASAATRAQANGTIAAVQPSASALRITGPNGSATVNISAGATQAQIETAINETTSTTGVEATGGVIRSTTFGSQAFVHIEELKGDLAGVTPGKTTGADIVAVVNGQNTTGNGNVINVVSNQLNAKITVQQDQTGSFSFQIAGGGATFQLGGAAFGTDRLTLGMGRADTTALGNSSGVGNLASLANGGANSLTNNPQNALKIIDAAANEVSALRGHLGTVESQIFESNIQAMGVASENLAASASNVGDADIAKATAALLRNRLLRESGLSVLRQANLNAGLVLRLLGA